MKRKLYERFGVAEYWVVDPELETVKCYRLDTQGFVLAGEYATERDDILTTLLLSALQVPLTQVFVSPYTSLLVTLKITHSAFAATGSRCIRYPRCSSRCLPCWEN